MKKNKITYPQWERRFKKLIQETEKVKPHDIVIFASQTMACYEDGLTPEEVYEKYKGDDLMYNVLSQNDKK